MKRLPLPALRSRGFTLLEVLIALLVLSLGLLGVAALQTMGLKFGHESYLRTQAVFQAYDILERIRANPLGVTNYSVVLGAAAPAITTNCATTSCLPADLAVFDMNHWVTNNANLLPGGTGSITAVGDIRRIVVQWEEKDMTMTLQVDAVL